MKNRRLTIFIVIGLIGVTSMLAQVPVNFENHFVRPLGDVLRGISEQFNVKFRYGIDTTGLNLNYADSRIRAYSLDGSECNEKKVTVEPYESLFSFGPNGEKLPDKSIHSYRELAKYFPDVIANLSKNESLIN